VSADRVQLVVVDVDGCLTPGEGRGWNWRALEAIAHVNRSSRRESEVPAVTLCTGRQEPYVEVLMQAISARLPAVYENGCGLYFPEDYRFLEHPAITGEVREALEEAKARLGRQVVGPGLGYFQPGNEISLTIYPCRGISLGSLYDIVARELVASDQHLAIQASVSCVDITPAGINKGIGVEWLSRETEIPLTAMGGIGDSVSDLAFLRLVGRSGAPANAGAEVRDAVEIVSRLSDGDGVVDIIRRWAGGALGGSIPLRNGGHVRSGGASIDRMRRCYK
jgi:hydroxymethylpyrimidine pyrophosphatase-like HAD family hydrolase